MKAGVIIALGIATCYALAWNVWDGGLGLLFILLFIAYLICRRESEEERQK